jgi:hypothetical protein
MLQLLKDRWMHSWWLCIMFKHFEIHIGHYFFSFQFPTFHTDIITYNLNVIWFLFEDGDSKDLRNVGNTACIYMMLSLKNSIDINMKLVTLS